MQGWSLEAGSDCRCACGHRCLFHGADGAEGFLCPAGDNDVCLATLGGSEHFLGSGLCGEGKSKREACSEE